jgi:hypothetical protein
MKKLGAIVVILFAVVQANAQFGGIYYQPRPRYARRPPQRHVDDGFKPSVNVTVGYGFPNLDKEQLLDFRDAYPGSVSQTGPFMGSIDYQFQRNLSLGVLVTSGTVNRNYYDGGSGALAFNGKLQNTAIMLNLVNYLPGTRTVSPYVRAALGANIWTNNYINTDGSRQINDDGLPDIAYQLSLGMKVNFTQHAGLFVEAGYGKYILAGGLAFKF